MSDIRTKYKDLIEFYKTKNIAVLMGGLSSEREVSIRSGENVYNALINLGFKVTKMDVDANIARKLVKENIDVAVIMLHGKYGEDGVIQGVLELLAMPYTGCDVLTGAIGINRIITKELPRTEGIPVAISGMAANDMPAMAKDTSMPSEEVFPKLFEYVKW